MLTMHRPKHRLTGQSDEGFIVAEIDTERGHFSITGEAWPSEASFKLGNSNAIFACGQIRDEISSAIPALRPWLHMHLRMIETGEPYLHGLSNLKYSLDPNGSYGYTLKSPYGYGGEKDPDAIAMRILEGQAETMNCTVDELPDRIDGTHVEDWYEAQMDRWAQEADDFREFLRSVPAPELAPADESTEEFEHDFGDGAKVSAKLNDNPVMVDRLGGSWVFEYTVTVETSNEIYEGKATGSIAEYEEGHTDAKGAAFNVLRELIDAGRDPDQFWEMVAEGGIRNAEQAKAITRVCEAGERMYEAFEDHRDIIGF